MCLREVERDNVYDNRVAELDLPSQKRRNPPLRLIVLLCFTRCTVRSGPKWPPSFLGRSPRVTVQSYHEQDREQHY